MGESLMEQCHVNDEGLFGRKILLGGKTLMVPPE